MAHVHRLYKAGDWCANSCIECGARVNARHDGEVVRLSMVAGAGQYKPLVLSCEGLCSCPVSYTLAISIAQPGVGVGECGCPVAIGTGGAGARDESMEPEATFKSDIIPLINWVSL